MRIDIVTLFPNAFSGPLDESMIRIARERNLVEIGIINLRDYTHDRHRTVDDRPFGGGPGMVLKPEPIFECVEDIRKECSRVILTTPQGRLLNQALARELSKEKHLIMICGSYEAVDQRVRDTLVDDEISIGDYVLTNGSLPAMVLTDCVVRLIPGVLGDAESVEFESFTENLLDYPHYTRPEVYRGIPVPEVLLSGNHQVIAQWRRRKALERTMEVRPELLSESKKNEHMDGAD
jgi:tRNA (guanine37-N1)-methyltransferase